MKNTNTKTYYRSENFAKASSRQQYAFVPLLLAFLLLNFFNPVLARSKAKISNIYFKDVNNLIVETKDGSSLAFLPVQRIDKGFKLLIQNAKTGKNVLPRLANRNYKIDVARAKSFGRAYWKSKDLVEVDIRSRSENAFMIRPRAVLSRGGVAYAIELNPIHDQWATIDGNEQASNPRDAVPKVTKKGKLSIANQDESYYQLSAKMEDSKVYTISQNKSEVDKFIEGLDINLSRDLINDTEFQAEVFRRVDSSGLSFVGDTLAAKGHRDQAAKAYRRALSLNSKNLNARLGLAEASDNKQEKIDNYEASVADRALISMAEYWFEDGLRRSDYKSIGRSLISYKLAIIRDPANPVYRMKYGKALEVSGGDNLSESAKRYLEAAVLVKQRYLNGDKSVERLLRESTESLIRVLTLQGDVENAVRYCNSYRRLGFERFMNGKQVLGVIREVEANRNPFCNKGANCAPVKMSSNNGPSQKELKG